MLDFYMQRYLFPRGQAGLCCDENGIALGPVAIVEKLNNVPGKRYRICSPEVFVKAFIVAYGAPPFELVQHFWEGIGRVTRSLEEGDVPLAMMKAIFLKLPEIEADNMAKLEAGEVEKVNPFHDAFTGGLAGVSGVEKSTYQTSAGELENARALEIALHGTEEAAKFNHCHDPKNGQFTFAPCGHDSNMEEIVVTAPKGKFTQNSVYHGKNYDISARQVGNIIYNEMRSFSGPKRDEGMSQVAHVIYNRADAGMGVGGLLTASSNVDPDKVPMV